MSTWVKPKASSGKKVRKADLALSMGIEVEAYDTILRHAKSIVLGSAVILTRSTWNQVDVHQKSNACQQLKEDISQRTGDTDFAEAKRLECTKLLSDGRIAEHFIFRAYQILRDTSRRGREKRRKEDNPNLEGSSAGN
ncbi:hypothetical protein EV426DRAFT_700502 [Tirmania nivea]|nr:hypothetical protein EV426DRAFT_700502 [Tirmania nivea]